MAPIPPSSGLAFFDSGGGEGLSAALGSAGWEIDRIARDYLWDARHPGTGEELRYVEGDVYRGRYLRPGTGRAGRGHSPQQDRGRGPPGR